MKKLITSLFIAVIAITSCSKNDETPVDPNTTMVILPKRTVTTSSSGTVGEVLLSYNGNKLATITTPSAKTFYTYSNDLIVKTESFDGTVLKNDAVYSYENDKVKTVIYREISTSTTFTNKYVYTYISGTSIKEERYKINADGSETKLTDVKMLTYLNGNLIKTVEEKSSTQFNGTIDIPTTNKYTNDYEYDNKNYVLKNCVGFNKIENRSVNNFTKRVQLSEGTYNNAPNPSTISTDIYEYKYNSDNFPTERKRITSSGISTEQYFY